MPGTPFSIDSSVYPSQLGFTHTSGQKTLEDVSGGPWEMRLKVLTKEGYFLSHQFTHYQDAKAWDLAPTEKNRKKKKKKKKENTDKQEQEQKKKRPNSPWDFRPAVSKKSGVSRWGSGGRRIRTEHSPSLSPRLGCFESDRDRV